MPIELRYLPSLIHTAFLKIYIGKTAYLHFQSMNEKRVIVNILDSIERASS